MNSIHFQSSLCSSLFLLGSLSGLAHADTIAPKAAGGPTATITIRADKPIGDVKPFVFGQNVEAADGKGIFGNNLTPEKTQTGDGLWNPKTHTPVPEVLKDAKATGIKMMRYPGGCLAHNFNWKQAVGPLAQRPNWSFGVDEFLAWCKAAGTEPLMNVSDYAATPQDAADLVEYLNAPATAKYPWAQKRAAWGHPKPHGVKYFEMGNETDHGNHNVQPRQKWTAAQYVTWFQDCSRRMRAIDPKIQMGALMGTGTGADDPWNATVLSGTRGIADFIIVHTYSVGISARDGEVTTYPADLLMRASMASVTQMEIMLGKYRTKIRQYAGRDVPLAITKYNASFVQEKPIPYRFSFGAALFSADYLRVLQQPQSNVLMANYWHFMNGYWGLLRGPVWPDTQPRQWKRQPAYYLFRLWGQHFGTKLVQTDVQSPRVEFKGIPGRLWPARAATYQPAQVDTTNLMAGKTLQSAEGKGFQAQVLSNGLLRVGMDNLQGEQFPPIANIPAPKGNGYVLPFEARVSGNMGEAKLGLGMVDSRGWDAAKSAMGVEGVETALTWKRFEGRFRTLPDSPGAILVWRLRAPTDSNATSDSPAGTLPDAPIAGTIEVRNIRITSFQSEQLPAYSAITSTASLSRDRRTLFVLVWNKHHNQSIPTTIQVQGFTATGARRWCVTGPSLEATNLEAEQVRETESGIATPIAKGKMVSHLVPPRSMLAFELRRRDPPHRDFIRIPSIRAR